MRQRVFEPCRRRIMEDLLVVHHDGLLLLLLVSPSRCSRVPPSAVCFVSAECFVPAIEEEPLHTYAATAYARRRRRGAPCAQPHQR